MKSTVNIRQRPNRAFRTALWPDAQRIHHLPNFPAFCHGWAVEELCKLSAPASKVLRFLAALNLTGTAGYVGVAVAYELLAGQIEKASGLKFSKRTMERAVHDLKEAGLVVVHPWVREAQQFRAGKRTVTMCGAGTVTLKNGAVVVRRLAILTISDKALAMWEPSRRRKKTKPSHSTAKMADSSSKIDQGLKTHELERNTVPYTKTELDTVGGKEGTTTPGEPRPRRTDEGEPHAVKHGGLKMGDVTLKHMPRVSEYRVTANQTGDKKALSKASKPRFELSAPPSKGCTKPRPLRRGPSLSYSRSLVDESILATIWDMLAEHSSREANVLFNRAVWELNNEGPHNWPMCIDWDYWRTYWPEYSHKMRRNTCRSQILPLLKDPFPMTPHDKPIVRSAEGAKTRESGKFKLDMPELMDLAARVGLGDKFTLG